MPRAYPVDVTEGNVVHLKVEPGFPSQDELKLRVSPGALDTLIEELEAEGLRAGPLLEMSEFDPNSAVAYLVYGVTVGSITVGRLANAISKWSHRHDGKKIEYDVNGQLKSTTGLSLSESRALLDEVLKRQRVRDREWDEFNRQHPPPQVDE